MVVLYPLFLKLLDQSILLNGKQKKFWGIIKLHYTYNKFNFDEISGKSS